MIHGSLFTGIGGFNVAAEELGWETIFNCEIDKFCQRILKYYWPNTIIYEDIKKTDFTRYRGTVDVLSAGVPCQPASVAGQRKGENDDRWLWPEMLRVIREIRPPFVICENPPGIISLGHGKPFASILSALEDEGYQIELFIIPACGIQAPHKRDRVWIIAYTNIRSRQEHRLQTRGKMFKGTTSSFSPNTRIKNLQKRENTIYESRSITNTTGMGQQPGTVIGEEISEKSGWSELDFRDKSQVASDTDSNKRSKGGVYPQDKKEAKRHIGSCYAWNKWEKVWNNFPTQPPVCGRNDGIPRELDSITFSKWRNESIKAYGNAIVPQISYEIFKAIEQLQNDI